MSGQLATCGAPDGATVEPEVRDDEAAGGAREWDVPKERRCLRCETSFQSAWSGERICARCKRSDAWRRGEPAHTTTSGRRRSSSSGA
jgi:hypothetical protein